MLLKLTLYAGPKTRLFRICLSGGRRRTRLADSPYNSPATFTAPPARKAEPASI
jgi:hypothetical protein